jgi:hypothetical protein
MMKKPKTPEKSAAKTKSKAPAPKGRGKEKSELSDAALDRVSGGLQSAHTHTKRGHAA